MTKVRTEADADRWHVPRHEELLPTEYPVQLMGADGTVALDERFVVDLTDDDLRQMYHFLVLTRGIDQTALNLGRQGQLAVYTSSLGQEAAQVGSAYALTETDWIFPSYRDHGAARVRGLDPVEQLHHNRGTWGCCHDPYQLRFAPQTVSIATQLPHAAGLATAAKMAGDPIAVIVYFGDGATSEGDAHEAMNFAGVLRAPCVFYCQNNGWAISVPFERQVSAPSVAHRGIAYGMPGIRVDGNDVLACYAVTRWAAERARSGAGPTLIEALTYRMEAHSGSDDPTRYRPAGELEYWGERDPIERFRQHLARRGLWDEEFQREVESQVAAESARLRGAIYDAPHGDPLELFDHVYATGLAGLGDQREQLRAELSAGVDLCPRRPSFRASTRRCAMRWPLTTRSWCSARTSPRSAASSG
jgi:2-oxoisovalerate dehydrogenase E1 component alpha subunit